MTEENQNLETRVEDKHYKEIERCLKEIKKDLRFLPCQSGEEDQCLQAKKTEQLEQAVTDSRNAFLLCHTEKLEPLIKNTALLHHKQDEQGKTIDRLEDKFDTLTKELQTNRLLDKNDLHQMQITLTKQITQIITQKETASMTKREIRDIIKWSIGIITGIAAVSTISYAIIKFIITIL